MADRYAEKTTIGSDRTRAEIEAKLEAVAAGITTVELEFLAFTCLPDGSTVGEWVAPQLAAGTMPALLPAMARNA